MTVFHVSLSVTTLVFSVFSTEEVLDSDDIDKLSDYEEFENLRDFSILQDLKKPTNETTLQRNSIILFQYLKFLEDKFRREPDKRKNKTNIAK